MKTLPILIWIFTCSIFAKAQHTVVKELAEPFTIDVAIANNAAMPAKGNSFGPFEVLDVQMGSKDVQVNTTRLMVQLIAYDTGTFRISNIIRGVDSAKDITVTISSPPENMVKEYAPIKEIDITWEEPVDYKNYLWILLLLVATAVVLLWLLKKRKPTLENVSKMPDEHWMDRLTKIADEWKNETLSSVQLGEGLISVLHARFDVPQKKSIRKLFKSIRHQIPGVNVYALKDILTLTDAWRFGKQQAEKLTGEKAIDTIKTIVDTKDLTQKK